MPLSVEKEGVHLLLDLSELKDVQSRFTNQTKPKTSEHNEHVNVKIESEAKE